MRGDGSAGNYTSSIHLADAAAAVVAAASSPAGGYNVVDDRPVTKAEHARALGARPWLSGPGRAGLLLGDRLTSMTRSLRVSNARFRAIADWRPRHPSVWEGYREMAVSVG
ncbi:hypothetical protein [Nocardia sp. NPDC057353]|uniref:hypothetical protein n=1 Tax=Nocardia sp. NPDC057353 TaxID=3346104 RepID=UPI00363685C8